MNVRAHTLALLIAAPLAAVAQSTPNPAYLERAQVLAADNEIKIYRLPAKDANGKIKYWDVTIPLVINNAGRPEATASVSSVASPTFLGTKFIPGTYKDAFDYACTVSVGLLNSGRQEGAMSCVYYDITAAWASGPVAGHPFELDLVAAGIDKIPGHENYAWGRVGYSGYVGAWGCFSTNDIISARQVGNQIAITNYGADNISDCGMTLTLQPL
jgi:hypothetical protein